MEGGLCEQWRDLMQALPKGVAAMAMHESGILESLENRGSDEVDEPWYQEVGLCTGREIRTLWDTLVFS